MKGYGQPFSDELFVEPAAISVTNQEPFNRGGPHISISGDMRATRVLQRVNLLGATDPLTISSALTLHKLTIASVSP